MDFDFSEDARAVADTARNFLTKQSPLTAIRRVFDDEIAYDADLWKRIAEMGWLGACIPEEFGGLDLGSEVVCVLAEEIGRALAPVPFTMSACMATSAICAHGRAAQKERILPKLAAGEAICTFALAEGVGDPEQARVAAQVRNGLLNGTKFPVPEGSIADFVILAARNGDNGIGLFLCNLDAPGISLRDLKAIDPSRKLASLTFRDVEVEPLDVNWRGWSSLQGLLDRFAIFLAYEQIGGAEVCLQMARDYAVERYAFGRPIGSFQAIKHKLADVFIACELARSNAYFATWALEEGAPDLPRAAAAARLSASEAFQLAARENIQTHGGIGITWEADCHLFFRRAKSLGLEIGGPFYWQERLMIDLESQGRL